MVQAVLLVKLVLLVEEVFPEILVKKAPEVQMVNKVKVEHQDKPVHQDNLADPDQKALQDQEVHPANPELMVLESNRKFITTNSKDNSKTESSAF